MWEALLEKTDEIADNLERIENSIMESYFKHKESGLLNGKMGYALYFSYLKEIKKTDQYDHHIEYAVGEATQFDETLLPTFCSGISGIFWGIHYLQHKKIIEADLSFDDYNTYLAQLIINETNNKNLDYLHGPVGNMLYLLDVAPGLASSIETTFINSLISIAQEDEHTIKWEMFIRNTPSSGIWGYNLSLSHGMSGLVLLLCALYKKTETNAALLKKLIEKSCNYILAQENKEPELSLFPTYIIPDQPLQKNSRLAWCYGDLGVGYALYQSGKTIDDAGLTENALRILLKTTERKTPQLTELNDSCLCHGTAGVAHFYNRIYQETKNEAFKETTIFWLKETIKLVVPEKDSCGGYTFYNALQQKYHDDYSLLEGLCGVGIILLAATNTVEPTWDRSLFLS